MDRRTRQRQQTSSEIVDAAEQVVLESDLEGLTVQAVASAMGMTAGALYRYFPSREAMVAAVEARVIEKLSEAIGEAVAQVPQDQPLVALLAVGEAMVGFAREHPRRYGLLSRMLAIPRPLVGDAEVGRVLPVALAALARVEALFAEARAQGQLSPGPDRERLAAWWAAIHGAIQLGKLVRFTEHAHPEAIVQTALRALALGWGAHPDHLRRRP